MGDLPGLTVLSSCIYFVTAKLFEINVQLYAGLSRNAQHFASCTDTSNNVSTMSVC